MSILVLGILGIKLIFRPLEKWQHLEKKMYLLKNHTINWMQGVTADSAHFLNTWYMLPLRSTRRGKMVTFIDTMTLFCTLTSSQLQPGLPALAQQSKSSLLEVQYNVHLQIWEDLGISSFIYPLSIRQLSVSYPFTICFISATCFCDPIHFQMYIYITMALSGIVKNG